MASNLKFRNFKAIDHTSGWSVKIHCFRFCSLQMYGLRYFYHQIPLDDSDWHQISYSVCVNQNLKTHWPHEFGKMNYIDLRPLKLKFPYIRMNCVCWWPLRQIVHSDVTGKVTVGFQLFICSLISLKSIKIPCSRNQCSQLLGQFSCKKLDCTTFI